MDIFQRLKKLVVFLYITAKWIGLIVWWIALASMVWAEGWSILLVSDRAGNPVIGVIFAILLFVPLIILSTVEWVLFGKFTWGYKSFDKKENQAISQSVSIEVKESSMDTAVNNAVAPVIAKKERLRNKLNLNGKYFVTWLIVISIIPVLVRTPENFPGIVYALPEFLIALSIEIFMLLFVGYIISSPFWLMIWLYVGKGKLSFRLLVIFALFILVSIDLTSTPRFKILHGQSGTAWPTIQR
ncbi:MAG TPA: hypothetical protein DDZ29_14570 [Alteromonas mediterranea]|uniref:Uncharacterized protein n=1 Tax=Alteromonas mediterranea TaxID=314275 RepID=A0AAC8XI49_9ALTE|nr:hypothetical protein [Alteromonas mediterranea]AGP96121.1 hypothetical protein I635_02880 [Alteromonas mediterranea UM7]AMJ77321.1 hypothetical protein AV942_02825 [Alteromonas mediterranea]AMJ81453.1 hypothetical protein AV941_02770 [Alteromonas mediterranea]HBL22046.1 hypothetical protein [Alteromonas mediterranea]|tara:strand:+ start:2933 stop:3658 length:726 start_codon:yes stop_codon:yes gene_type:complete